MSTKLGDIGDSLKELYTEAMKNIDRGILLSYLNGPRRKGHWEEDPTERARYDDFAKRWNALVEEGFNSDFLMRDYDGLCLDVPTSAATLTSSRQ